MGTKTRPDGSVQATYDGVPLYRFAADKAPGDTSGQGVGGIWFAVSVSGSAAGATGATATTTPARATVPPTHPMTTAPPAHPITTAPSCAYPPC